MKFIGKSDSVTTVIRWFVEKKKKYIYKTQS